MKIWRQDRQGAGGAPAHAAHRRRPSEGITFEVQLGDSRWLQINERRTKDGGFVSVGTDITALKQQEERLLLSERELMTDGARPAEGARDSPSSSRSAWPISPTSISARRRGPRQPTGRSRSSSPI